MFLQNIFRVQRLNGIRYGITVRYRSSPLLFVNFVLRIRRDNHEHNVGQSGEKIVANFSEEEKHELFYGTAARVYQI